MTGIQKAVRFFKSESAYRQLFIKFRKKYESLGRIGGNVPVTTFTADEIATIGTFFGESGETIQAKGSVSLQQFEKQLQKTRFGDVGLKQLLDVYFGEVIISKKQHREQEQAKLTTFLRQTAESYPELAHWLRFLHDKPAEGRWIVRIAQDDQNYFLSLLRDLSEAIQHLPVTAERLPMFSQRITGDPHAFDLQTNRGKMFLHLLTVEKNLEEASMPFTVPKTTEEINDLLQQFRIYRDDLLNFVTCAGLIAETDAGVHPVFQEAVTYNTVQNVPLREIAAFTRVYPAKGKQVWVVENSGVCSTLLDYVRDTPIISTNGQFKLAALMLMDMLAEEGCTLNYAGDFDPEGLQMAQRLAERYPDNVAFWQMGLAAYLRTAPVKALSHEQLDKLNGIVHPDLAAVAKEMRKKAKAGYQEALLDSMVEDIRKGYREDNCMC